MDESNEVKERDEWRAVAFRLLYALGENAHPHMNPDEVSGAGCEAIRRLRQSSAPTWAAPYTVEPRDAGGYFIGGLGATYIQSRREAAKICAALNAAEALLQGDKLRHRIDSSIVSLTRLCEMLDGK